MHEIELSVSQPIIFGFEKLKHQNFYMSVQVEIFTISIQRAVCTLSLHVEIFGCPLRNHSLFKCRGGGDFEGALISGKSPIGGHLFLSRKIFKKPTKFLEKYFPRGGEEGHFFLVFNEIWNIMKYSGIFQKNLQLVFNNWATQISLWVTRKSLRGTHKTPTEPHGKFRYFLSQKQYTTQTFKPF